MGGVDDESRTHAPAAAAHGDGDASREGSTDESSPTRVHSQCVTGLGTGRSTPYVILRRPGRRVIQVSFISFMEAIQPISDPGYVLGTRDGYGCP